jgi:hypothetical protein
MKTKFAKIIQGMVIKNKTLRVLLGLGLVGLVVLLGGYFLLGRKKTSPSLNIVQIPPVTPTPLITPTPTLTPTPTPIPVGLPIKIEIPKLNLVAEITPIGVTPKQNLDVPQNASQVGWFKEGVRPGQVGAALFTGHYDTPSGRPAIFYQLKALAPGDEIIVLTNWGERFVFRTERLVSESYKAFPKEFLYGKLATRELRLITCDGVWSAKERSYSKRLVILATL